MKFQHLRPALSYAAARQKPRLPHVIQDKKDAGLALYILEKKPETLDATSLGLSLIWATGQSHTEKNKWMQVLQALRNHPKAPDILPYTLRGCLVDAATEHNVEAVKTLVSFPQVSAIPARDWDDVLFYVLPKGDPEKKRIEKRAFEDREGHPEILNIVRQAMTKTAISDSPAAPTYPSCG
ncbi:MAG: hypothetical protein OXT65_12670 [Alphaproteobacteria bacterium]|nr:hypothetical protein [Alphaproteobacteria bacterium]